MFLPFRIVSRNEIISPKMNQHLRLVEVESSSPESGISEAEIRARFTHVASYIARDNERCVPPVKLLARGLAKRSLVPARIVGLIARMRRDITVNKQKMRRFTDARRHRDCQQ